MPLTSRTEVKLSEPGRYLTQLCKHFGHKLETEQNGNTGTVHFYYCTCTLTADDEVLNMILSNIKEEHVAEMEEVLDDHLKRFAFREEPDIKWIRVNEEQ